MAGSPGSANANPPRLGGSACPRTLPAPLLRHPSPRRGCCPTTCGARRARRGVTAAEQCTPCVSCRCTQRAPPAVACGPKSVKRPLLYAWTRPGGGRASAPAQITCTPPVTPRRRQLRPTAHAILRAGCSIVDPRPHAGAESQRSGADKAAGALPWTQECLQARPSRGLSAPRSAMATRRLARLAASRAAARAGALASPAAVAAPPVLLAPARSRLAAPRGVASALAMRAAVARVAAPWRSLHVCASAAVRAPDDLPSAPPGAVPAEEAVRKEFAHMTGSDTRAVRATNLLHAKGASGCDARC